MALLLAEGLLTLHRLIKYGNVGRKEVIKMRRQVREDVIGGTGNAFENRLVLHPFFGYTYNPKDEGINTFGFDTKYDLVLDKSGYSLKGASSNEVLSVGIFGGSFAELTANEHEYLERKLEPLFPGKRVAVLNFAVGGHAIPQSAFIYLYFRELFDVVIFIDGLNELWNSLDNYKAGFSPEYAKAQHYTYKISRQELTPLQFQRTAAIISLKRRLHFVTSVSLLPVFRESLCVHYGWRALQNRWLGRAARLMLEIQSTYTSDHRLFAGDDESVLDYAARQWRRYHKLIADVASREGSLSMVLLQPNPFVPGSKTLTLEEEHLIRNSYPVEDYVVKGYPKLQAELSRLRKEGVAAEDLTDIFKAVSGSIWTDSAHANQAGSRLIMDRIVQLVSKNRDSLSLSSASELPK